jgi:hypothetical protein
MATAEDFPLAHWQESGLAPNEPIYVLHTSHDKAWDFVLTSGLANGWVQREDIAYIVPEFITHWKTGQYVTPLQDDVPVTGNTFEPLARVGQLMPLVPKQTDSENYQVLIVFSDVNGHAGIEVSTVPKTETAVMPLLATPANMVCLANNLMRQPYGWEGAEGYRDCSGLIKDLLMPFAIWMPRDTAPQAEAGTLVSLEGLNNDQKETVIKEQGIPFFSLIWSDGHISLYVGTEEEHVYVYNDIWGLNTHCGTSKEEQSVLGRTVIMPLGFGKEYTQQTLLDKAKGLILLQDRLLYPYVSEPQSPLDMEQPPPSYEEAIGADRAQ